MCAWLATTIVPPHHRRHDPSPSEIPTMRPFSIPAPASVLVAILACAALAGCTGGGGDLTAPAERSPSLAKVPNGGAIAALVVAPATVTGGATAQGTVTIGSAAPAKGTVVALASSHPAVAAVPASVTIPRGQTSATFAITTAPTAGASVTITASQGRSARSASLTVVAPRLARLALSPATIAVGATGQGTVTLDGPAPASTTVSLASGDPAVLVPPTVTIQAGMTGASFEVQGVAPAPSVTIAATLGADTRTATLGVR